MFTFIVMNMNHPSRPALASSDRAASVLHPGSSRVVRLLKLSLKLDSFFLRFPSEKGLEARVGIEQVCAFRHFQRPSATSSPPEASSLMRIEHSYGQAFPPFCQVRLLRTNNHPLLSNYSVKTRSLALSLDAT
jgi:hypothetical protein